jgi:hypothetical protein
VGIDTCEPVQRRRSASGRRGLSELEQLGLRERRILVRASADRKPIDWQHDDEVYLRRLYKDGELAARVLDEFTAARWRARPGALIDLHEGNNLRAVPGFGT